MLVTKDFVLVHVPKTGGTFLGALMKQHCEVLFEDMHRPYSQVPDDFSYLPAIGFVRNPFEWYVSWFEHMKQSGPESKDEWPWIAFRLETADFAEFLERAFNMPGEYDYYSGQVRHFTFGCQVGRTEHLREWFVRFLRQHRVENPALVDAVLTAPPINVGDHRPFESYYNPHTTQQVWKSWVAQTYGYVLGAAAEIPSDPPMTHDDILRRKRLVKEVEAAWATSAS